MPDKIYDMAFTDQQKMVPPNQPLNLFREATLNQYHVDTAKGMGQKFETYIEGICGATWNAVNTWASTATIQGVLIMGPTASMGMVVGPPLTPLILAQGPKTTPMELRYTTAIATAIGNGWLAWTASIKVPGLPWYPAFAAVPSPVAPPVPNVPTPLLSLISVDASLSPGALKGSMMGVFGDPPALHAADLFDAVSQAFNTVFTMYKTSTMVKNVMGTGPVPTFAPPFVPVGPVIGGIGTGLPGCFM